MSILNRPISSGPHLFFKPIIDKGADKVWLESENNQEDYNH
jgi:hypothetical protein